MKAEEIKRLREKWFAENEPTGKALGYPDCCIKEFCDQPPELLKGKNPATSDVLRFKAGCINGKFTGFIPCYFHAQQIIMRKITLESLIKNRDIFLPPFPDF